MEKISQFIAIKLDKRVIFLLDFLNRYCRAFIVGGSVRDLVMEYLGLGARQVGDIDIAVDVEISKIKHLIPEISHILQDKDREYLKDCEKKYIINQKYNILSFEGLEIASFRLEKGVKDNRNPQNIYFIKDKFIDSYRRDFKINAFYFNSKSGLIDTQNGLDDLKRREISFVGWAKDKIEEDASRIFRLMYYSAKLRLKISSEDIESLIIHQDIIFNISSNIVFSFYKKIFNNIDLHFLINNKKIIKKINKLPFKLESNIIKNIKFYNAAISLYLDIPQYYLILPFVPYGLINKSEKKMLENLNFLSIKLYKYPSIKDMISMLISLSISNIRAKKLEIIKILQIGIYLFTNINIKRKILLINLVDNLKWVHFEDLNISKKEIFTLGLSKQKVNYFYEIILKHISTGYLKNKNKDIINFINLINLEK